MSAKLSEKDFIASIETRRDIRLFFVFGPDESAAASIAGNMVGRLGSDSEAVEIDSAKLRGDPALLADEAASQSLFGGARHIRLHFAREEGLDAIANLLSAEQAGNPVIATAGDLKKNSKTMLTDKKDIFLTKHVSVTRIRSDSDSSGGSSSSSSGGGGSSGGGSRSF